MSRGFLRGIAEYRLDVPSTVIDTDDADGVVIDCEGDRHLVSKAGGSQSWTKIVTLSVFHGGDSKAERPGQLRPSLSIIGGANEDRTHDLYNAITFRTDFAEEKGENLDVMHHNCTTTEK